MTNDALHSLIEEREPNICQIEVYQDGMNLFSDCWNRYTKDSCAHIASVTKSVMSLLLGIAIDKGMIGSVDDKVLDYFPEYQVRRGEKTIFDVTIRHLLTMRAPYKGKGDPWTKVCSSDNWTYASLDFLGGRKGLTGTFDYRNVCLHILSGILHKATGMKTADFANRYLFMPLGIAPRSNFHALNAEEHKHFTIDKNPKGKVWFADPEGLGTPGYGLCLSATEMAKIGLLCLGNGMCNGQRIVSGNWISEMTRPMPVQSGLFQGMRYGYLWWIIHPERNIYAAIGNSGNVIYVDPHDGIVVSVTAYFRPSVFDRIDFIEKSLLPSICMESRWFC